METLKPVLIGTLVIVILISGWWIWNKTQSSELNIETQCEFNEMIFYYLDTCSWCQKVKNEGTIGKIEELGVKVNQVNAKFGPIEHEFQGVPTFVINEKVYSGYRTFEELKELLNCQ
ncbi:MAG: hypothetical protein HWN80_19620 [Candidatus Lokiarchaeota archaeon]|nr:hypothetical protein [Candidatus Lokiarchaeota archaeon]